MTAVATDLDGTLLETGATLGAAARDVVHRLAACGVPLVLLTSKTESELRRFLSETRAAHGTFENGAGIVGPRGVELDAHALRVDELEGVLRALEHSCRAPLVPIGALSDEALHGRTGLTGDAAREARLRAYDLPFLAPASTAAELREALAAFPRVALAKGGVFWHLSGRHDKGTAFDLLAGKYAFTRPFVGLGDAANDAPFLLRCDEVVVVSGERGVAPALRGLFPQARVARCAGAGWAEAVADMGLWSPGS